MAARIDPSSALESLLAGNRRWANGIRPAPHTPTAMAPRPIAALLCCAELGFEPERLFGRRGGSLFVLQGAGVCLSHATRSGIAYAVTALHLRLVLVMAHTGCDLARGLHATLPDRSDGCVHHRSWGAIGAAERLLGDPDVGPLLQANGADVVPLVFDHASSRVRLLC